MIWQQLMLSPVLIFSFLSLWDTLVTYASSNEEEENEGLRRPISRSGLKDGSMHVAADTGNERQLQSGVPCKKWCLTNSKPWTQKCTWVINCAGCNPCKDSPFKATSGQGSEPLSGPTSSGPMYSNYGINSATRHSSRVNISISNFSIAPPKPLSPLATCCVARHFYEADYQLLSEKDFTKQICKGSNSSICESAIEAIVERHSWVWQLQSKSMSCQDLLLLNHSKKINTVTFSTPHDEIRGRSTLFILALFVACFIRLIFY